MLDTEDERERDVAGLPTALRRPLWPYVRLRYSWVDICRRPEDDRALLLRLGAKALVPELRLAEPLERYTRVPELRLAEPVERYTLVPELRLA